MKAARYACRGCGTERVLPESPTSGPATVRAGCERCGRIVEHERWSASERAFRIFREARP